MFVCNIVVVGRGLVAAGQRTGRWKKIEGSFHLNCCFHLICCFSKPAHTFACCLEEEEGGGRREAQGGRMEDGEASEMKI